MRVLLFLYLISYGIESSLRKNVERKKPLTSIKCSTLTFFKKDGMSRKVEYCKYDVKSKSICTMGSGNKTFKIDCADYKDLW